MVHGSRITLRAGTSARALAVIAIAAGLWGVSLLPAAAADSSVNRWRNLFPSTNADSKDSHNMAWDADSDRMVMFGGHQGGCQVAGCFNRTYFYDFAINNWTSMDIHPNMEKRAEFGMTYDSRHDRIVTFGGPAGYPGGGPSTTAWTWTFDYDNLTWSNLTSSLAQSPPPTGVCRIAYDSQSDRTIFWRPGSIDVYALSIDAMTWERLTPPTPRPPDGASYSMSYDSGHDRVVVTVKPWGAGMVRETWMYHYDSNAWQRRAQTGPFPADDTSGGAIPWTTYDSASDRTVLYMDDQVTWTYNWTADQWVNMGVAGPPGHHFTFVHVPEQDAVLFYGGVVGGNRNTWVYELTPPDVEEGIGTVVGGAAAAVIAALCFTLRRNSRRGRSLPL
jgi:hypothetical protein